MKAKTLEELLCVQGTLVMPEDDIRTYAYERKLSPDPSLLEEQLRALSRIRIHNAKTTAEVEAILRSADLEYVTYTPVKSTEAHFYVPKTGHLHIVNSRGVTRLKRDVDLALVLGYFLQKDLPLTIDNYTPDNETPSVTDDLSQGLARANHRFRHFAFKLVEKVFDEINSERIRRNGRLTVLMGPYVSLDTKLDPKDITAQYRSDYLDCRTLRVGEEVVINFDYIFADQARDVLTELYSVANAKFRNAALNINIFHYGKAGILNPKIDVGSILIPVAALDEPKVLAGRARVSPIYNELSLNELAAHRFRQAIGETPHSGTTINTTSVILQTREALQQGLDAEGDFLDMEWAPMAGLDQGYESMYPWLGRVHYLFAGVGSDKPLEGRTLGNTEYARTKEAQVASALLRLIAHTDELRL